MVTGCASGILAGCLHSCSWARCLLFELVQSSGYVIPGSVCEEHIDDLSQFATSSSLTQLLPDAAQIGRKLRDCTASLGLTLSCKSTILANDKSLEKLIVGHIAAEGVHICREKAATVLGIETAAGKRRCASNRWKRIWKGRRRAKRVNRLCKMNPAAQKLRMTGINFSSSSSWSTAQEASTAQVVAMFRNLKMDTVMDRTRACAVSTVALFFETKRVPQVATRVEQVSQWITMWRGFKADTRRRIRKVWKEIATYSGK